MPDSNKSIKKTASDKKPVPFRIEQETAEKLREIAKDFSNQDVAFNALMAAYERENLMTSQPAYAEDVRQFEEYQRLLSAKYTDMLNALATSDNRARVEVQQLLASKDISIQDLQAQLEKEKSSRGVYETMYRDSQEENNSLKKDLEKERLASQGLRKEMEEKEEKANSALADKERLNDILTKNIDEKQRELDKLSSYPEQMEQKDSKIQLLTEQVRGLEDEAKEAEYSHRMEILEKERQIEQARTEVMKEMSDEAVRQREKHEKEIERLREKYDQLQQKMQDLLASGNS